MNLGKKLESERVLTRQIPRYFRSLCEPNLSLIINYEPIIKSKQLGCGKGHSHFHFSNLYSVIFVGENFMSLM